MLLRHQRDIVPNRLIWPSEDPSAIKPCEPCFLPLQQLFVPFMSTACLVDAHFVFEDLFRSVVPITALVCLRSLTPCVCCLLEDASTEPRNANKSVKESQVCEQNKHEGKSVWPIISARSFAHTHTQTQRCPLPCSGSCSPSGTRLVLMSLQRHTCESWVASRTMTCPRFAN